MRTKIQKTPERLCSPGDNTNKDNVLRKPQPQKTPGPVCPIPVLRDVKQSLTKSRLKNERKKKKESGVQIKTRREGR